MGAPNKAKAELNKAVARRHVDANVADAIADKEERRNLLKSWETAVAAEAGVSSNTARHLVAKTMRLQRHPNYNAPGWGGYRLGAGRPKAESDNGSRKQP